MWLNRGMTTERRKSPRRSVQEIRRTGAWGNVLYHHHLDCGHIEVRPRSSVAPKIACTWCLKIANRNDELNLRPIAPPVDENPDGDYDDLPQPSSGQSEISIEATRSALAETLSVPVDAVDLVSIVAGDSLEIQSALVFLSANDVARLTGKQ
jgi:hypothetical protein